MTTVIVFEWHGYQLKTLKKNFEHFFSKKSFLGALEPSWKNV